ncbi:MAG TPA: MFS transporter [Gemmatimonadaceae bacterium]|nr:MFS transporter [Gemmatimonadaceae bacterium]
MNTRRASLGRNVLALGIVSFFTDVSSEMIYPLLPVFLTSVLGATPGMLGAIEGAAETTAAFVKLASGWWSDRVRRRKPLVIAGYTLAAAMRPLVAIAQSGMQVLLIRVSDRIGKGIRNSPRDALIADSVDPSIRGRAFGFHRAADNAGAVFGPLIAFALLNWAHAPIRTVFWLAVVPGALAIVVVVAGVREVARVDGAAARETADLASRMPSRFWALLVVIFIFTLGNSTDAFLLLRAQQLGVPVAFLPILWAALHVVKSASNTPGGALSDRVGRKTTLVSGWLLYAAVYVAFAVARTQWHAWAIFLVYGLFFGLTEGTERAFVSDMVPASRRGSAFGWYYLAVGVAALPASVIFGLVWERVAPGAAFTMGASLALLASLGLAAVPVGAVQQQRVPGRL